MESFKHVGIHRMRAERKQMKKEGNKERNEVEARKQELTLRQNKVTSVVSLLPPEEKMLLTDANVNNAKPRVIRCAGLSNAFSMS